MEQMNVRAAQLGMKDTHFTRNACGLDAEGHLVHGADVAIMSRQILTTTARRCCIIQASGPTFSAAAARPSQ